MSSILNRLFRRNSRQLNDPNTVSTMSLPPNYDTISLASLPPNYDTISHASLPPNFENDALLNNIISNNIANSSLRPQIIQSTNQNLPQPSQIDKKYERREEHQLNNMQQSILIQPSQIDIQCTKRAQQEEQIPQSNKSSCKTSGRSKTSGRRKTSRKSSRKTSRKSSRKTSRIIYKKSTKKFPNK